MRLHHMTSSDLSTPSTPPRSLKFEKLNVCPFNSFLDQNSEVEQFSKSHDSSLKLTLMRLSLSLSTKLTSIFL